MRPVHVFNSQDLIFRQTTNLPPIGTKQKVPHELDFTVDASTDIWDVELERKLIDKGIWSHAVKLKYLRDKRSSFRQTNITASRRYFLHKTTKEYP